MMRARKSMSPLRIMMMILITALFMLWLVIPFILTVLWSLVDKTHPLAWPDALPPVLSLGRWVEVWTTTALPQALKNSYLLAATVSVLTLLLALPAAWRLAGCRLRVNPCYRMRFCFRSLCPAL